MNKWLKYIAGIIGSGIMLVFVVHMLTLFGLFMIDIEAIIKANEGDYSWIKCLVWLYSPIFLTGAFMCAFATWPS